MASDGRKRWQTLMSMKRGKEVRQGRKKWCSYPPCKNMLSPGQQVFTLGQGAQKLSFCSQEHRDEHINDAGLEEHIEGHNF